MKSQVRNAGHAFDSSDMDGDGYLDHRDMEVVAVSVSDRLGLAEDSARREAVITAYAYAWRNAVELIGTDERGRISREAYIRHVTSRVLDRIDFTARIVWPIGDALWDALDTDGDEQLTRAEYLRLWGAYDVAGRAARAAFERLDSNRDGRLSKDEFAQAIYDFYFGAAADVPIFG
ncbi:EF-hand domain-containing protein [Nonomuraea sp. NPDC050310]|uniref:EF-hand domain-containing protein n=1 Tax=unclassified Nonomuraea TaxID=2593643 RepID=UPI0033FFC5B0